MGAHSIQMAIYTTLVMTLAAVDGLIFSIQLPAVLHYVRTMMQHCGPPFHDATL